MFSVIKEEQLGSNIFVLFLKEIAYHFLLATPETATILNNVLAAEDDIIAQKKSYFVYTSLNSACFV
jgi:hypothetical protein